MAQGTLLEMAREVHLYSGGLCPILLAQRWVRDRFRKVCERALWSFKLGRGAFATSDMYSTGTITLTSASATVIGVGTTFTAGMVGRQLRVQGYVFTITAFTSVTSITIDQAWLGATTADLQFDIVQAYVTPTPTDFYCFYSVIDPFNAWRIQLSYNVKDLDRIDARRSSAGTPRLLANGVYNLSQVAVYELWPHPTTARHYPYIYEKRVADLTLSTDTPPPIIRSDVLVKGALCDLARWPGTVEQKNPMYDPYFNQWKIREGEFETEVNRLMVEDQSILLTDLTHAHELAWAPLDAKFIQNHAF